MDIQRLEHNDIHLITELLPPDWETIIPVLESYTKMNFCFSIKVTMGKKIVGVGTTIMHKDTAWLSNIIVHPDYRNQGIGKTITQTLVKESNAKYCDTIYLLATDLGEPVYKKSGFETETEYLFFKREKAIETFPDCENIIGFTDIFRNQILNLDRQASGEDRKSQLEQHLSKGFIYLHDNEVKGFYLPTLGDGLIIATTTSAGQELMRLRLTSKDFAAFPIDNTGAIAFINQNGFKKVRREKRMRFGKRRHWHPADLYNRIGGNLG